MSFLRFLAAGHCIVGIKDGPSPYKVAQVAWLRELSTDVPTGETILTPARAASQPATGLFKWFGQRAVRAVRMEPALNDKQRHEPSASSSSAFPSKTQSTRPALNQVTVVRNDLKDADIEVAPAKNSVRPATAQRSATNTAPLTVMSSPILPVLGNPNPEVATKASSTREHRPMQMNTLVGRLLGSSRTFR